jgi:hypothetical protein
MQQVAVVVDNHFFPRVDRITEVVPGEALFASKAPRKCGQPALSCAK